MVAKITDRIGALEQRLKQLKTQQQRMEARRRAQKAKRERREDLRKKILVGSIVLALVERGEIDEMQLQSWLDDTLSREEDRKLFGLNGAAKPPSGEEGGSRGHNGSNGLVASPTER